MDELSDIKRKKLSSWDVMSSILKPKVNPNKEEIQSLNSFFFCRYLISNKHSVPIAAVINRYHHIPLDVQFRFAQDYSDLVNLPSYVKFINYRPQKTPKEMEVILKNLERRYKVSRQTAEMYFETAVKTPEGQKMLSETMEMYIEGIQ